MLSLKDINIESVYSSEDINILKEFYIPILSVAVNYCRITGFFSSDSLAVAAKGIANLIRNGGNMKLITGVLIKKEDILVAEEVLKNPIPFIEEIESRINNFEEIENIFIKESVKALAWMLSKDLLKIKIALPKKDFKDEFNAIFHLKIGIIKDLQGNKISFSGSINETGVGWLKNIEEFKVFRNWKEVEKEYFENDYNRFFKLWNNLSDKVEVIPLYQAIRNRLLKFAPKSKEDINLDILDGKFSVPSTLQFNLRDYQQEAINKWKNNSYKGLIEMATGTGKTYVGIDILKEFFKKKGKSLVLILSPTNEINKQWKEKIEKYVNCKIIVAGSNNQKWRKLIENSIHDYKKGRINRLTIVSTYDSLSNVINYLDGLFRLLLIADEVHSFGSKERIKILDSETFDKIFTYRVGLSATPERIYDPVGSNKIKDFFGGIIFKMTIGEAIKKDILCPYNYFTNVVEMTNKEFKEYMRLTKKLGRTFNIKNLDEEEYLTILSNKRANIIKSAENKFNVLKDVLEELQTKNNLKYTFIFCLDFNQMAYVKSILDELKITYSQITGKESLQDREKILSSFAKGDIYVISSMKVLNEGIDIPNVKNAIILSSSSNPREYIQRRGRVLRKIKGEKKIANIFDFIVVPPQITKDSTLFDIERKILKKELLRTFEFLRYSLNKSSIFRNHKLIKLIEKYDLSELYSLLKTKY